MENKNDFEFIKSQLDSLPEIALPSSLTAESLWARVDAGELSAEEVEPEQSKVLLWVKKMRPVLSYAAVFVVMVAVYYSAGLDSFPNAIPAPAAEAPQMMMAAPPVADAPTAGAQPRMVMEQNDDAAPVDTPEAMLASPSPEEQGAAGAAARPDTADIGQDTVNAALTKDITADSFDSAALLEKHLLSTLSPEDYGGMYVESADEATLHIWVVNQEAVDAAINSYQSTPCRIVTEAARCSLADLKVLASALERVELGDGEILRAYISETDNTVAVNIAKAGEDKLKKKISSAIQANGIPSECVTVFTVDTVE